MAGHFVSEDLRTRRPRNSQKFSFRLYSICMYIHVCTWMILLCTLIMQVISGKSRVVSVSDGSLLPLLLLLSHDEAFSSLSTVCVHVYHLSPTIL